jgi:hypothetical protein
MEKKGDILNQLAIISDLYEKLSIDVKSTTVILEIPKVEFEKVFDMIEKKYNKKMGLPDDTFTIKIGNVDFIFNTNNA